MKHSIITWDCAFRNFFHLLPSLAEQDYDLDTVEVIVVQQRSREIADAYAQQEEVPTLEETVDRLSDRLNVRVVYLDEPVDQPYHPGRLLNEGLRMGQGEYLATMDADLLVPRNFLTVLDRVHRRDSRVVTMHRYQATFPCGTTKEDWKRQIIDYDLVRNICKNRFQPIPEVVTNKAPLLSAPEEIWKAVEMYDEHRLFSTAYTLFGVDMSTRFALLVGQVETPIPLGCVHPWHPTEISRDDTKIRILFQAQDRLIKHGAEQGCYRPSQRIDYADELYETNRTLIETAIDTAEANMIESSHGRSTEKACES